MRMSPGVPFGLVAGCVCYHEPAVRFSDLSVSKIIENSVVTTKPQGQHRRLIFPSSWEHELLSLLQAPPSSESRLGSYLR